MRHTRITCIITSHNREEDLRAMYKNLKEQTFTPYEVIPICSGYTGYLPVKGIEVEDKNDWGHEKRALGIKEARGLYMMFANDDDYYHPDFLEKLTAKAHESKADIIYCNFTSHNHGGKVVNSRPEECFITSGNFIVRTSLAKRVGWNHRHYQADWEFINDCKKAGATFAKVDEVLYEHR